MMRIIKNILTTLVVGLLAVPAAWAVQPSSAMARTAQRVVRVGEELLSESGDIAGMVPTKKAVGEALANEAVNSIVPDMLAYAKTHMGKRYRRGTSGPNTFDCSGFTKHVMGQFGYSLSPSSRAQYTQGVGILKSEALPGDLIFFAGRKGGRTVGHVGLVTEVDPVSGKVKFIHATNSQGIRVDTYPDGGYYSKRFIGMRRVLSDADMGMVD